MVGSALAIYHGIFFPAYSIVALLCSILIQIGTNFTNDLYDYLKGTDTEERKGPLRVLASGLISVKEMKWGIFFVFFIAFLLGLYLVYSVGLMILWIGIFSIIAGLAYTAGPFPLAYNGLGDLFVFYIFWNCWDSWNLLFARTAIYFTCFSNFTSCWCTDYKHINCK